MAQENVFFEPNLIKEFDIPGPRYTSYPTADRFLDSFDARAFKEHLAARSGSAVERALSLYLHIPFCNTVCYYCACNKIATKDHSLVEKYLQYLDKEMSMQLEHLSGSRLVSQIHWGGGTPTFLSPAQITQLMASIRRHFTLQPDGEFSIEIDPRKVDDATVALLAKEGFNRMSVGVQDFNPVVQKAVNREQSVEETALVINAARRHGFQSVSVDLIYGLPHQTVAAFDKTLDAVLAMQPDRLALYSYAHLPRRFMPQRRINEIDLPLPEVKLAIFAHALERLQREGYVYIGMDHFARPDNELSIAQEKGRLYRNFQGYSTHAECDMLAFGVSSIGRVGGAYSQNARDLDSYYAAIDKDELPVMRGWALSVEDQMRYAIIQSLMCNFRLSFEAIELEYGLDNFREKFAIELKELEKLAQAGLVSVENEWLTVTNKGRLLVRVVAMVFDRYLREDQAAPRYSKVI